MNETTRTIGTQIENAINVCSCDPYNVGKYLAKFTHRYLCNEFFKIAINFIQHMSDNYDEGSYDGRNEYACKASKKITDLMKSNPMDDTCYAIVSNFNRNKKEE